MKKLPHLFALTTLCVSTLTIEAYAATSAQTFVQKASVANEFEIESSKLALQKSQNSDVKSFAQTMVDDHSKTGDKLNETLKSSKSGAKPAGKLDNKHQKLMGKLEATDGKAFDKQYIAMQTDAHKEAVSLFSDYSKNGQDAQIKEFATQTLPALESHLDHVKQLSSNQ